jgi:hypothetical protein
LFVGDTLGEERIVRLEEFVREKARASGHLGEAHKAIQAGKELVVDLTCRSSEDRAAWKMLRQVPDQPIKDLEAVYAILCKLVGVDVQKEAGAQYPPALQTWGIIDAHLASVIGDLGTGGTAWGGPPAGGSETILDAPVGIEQDHTVEQLQVAGEAASEPARPDRGVEASPRDPKISTTPQVVAQRREARLSPDGGSVNWFGTTHWFSAMQAACFQVLFEEWEGEGRALKQAYILVTAGADSKRLSDLFKHHTTWGTVIVPGPKPGTFMLKAPPLESDDQATSEHQQS